MERPVVSFEEFEEIFEDMAFEPEEISFFVNTLINAASDNVPAFYHYDGVSLVVTPNGVTVDADIVYKDICVEVTLLRSDYSSVEEFEETFEDMAFEPEEVSLFVNIFYNASGIDERIKEVEKEMLEECKRWEEEGRREAEEDIEEIVEEFLKESEILKERLNKK